MVRGLRAPSSAARRRVAGGRRGDAWGDPPVRGVLRSGAGPERGRAVTLRPPSNEVLKLRSRASLRPGGVAPPLRLRSQLKR